MASSDKKIRISGEDRFSSSIQKIEERFKSLNNTYEKFVELSEKSLTDNLDRFNKQLDNTISKVQQIQKELKRTEQSSVQFERKSIGFRPQSLTSTQGGESSMIHQGSSIQPLRGSSSPYGMYASHGNRPDDNEIRAQLYQRSQQLREQKKQELKQRKQVDKEARLDFIIEREKERRSKGEKFDPSISRKLHAIQKEGIKHAIASGGPGEKAVQEAKSFLKIANMDLSEEDIRKYMEVRHRAVIGKSDEQLQKEIDKRIGQETVSQKSSSPTTSQKLDPIAAERKIGTGNVRLVKSTEKDNVALEAALKKKEQAKKQQEQDKWSGTSYGSDYNPKSGTASAEIAQLFRQGYSYDEVVSMVASREERGYSEANVRNVYRKLHPESQPKGGQKGKQKQERYTPKEGSKAEAYAELLERGYSRQQILTKFPGESAGIRRVEKRLQEEGRIPSQKSAQEPVQEQKGGEEKYTELEQIGIRQKENLRQEEENLEKRESLQKDQHKIQDQTEDNLEESQEQAIKAAERQRNVQFRNEMAAKAAAETGEPDFAGGEDEKDGERGKDKKNRRGRGRGGGGGGRRGGGWGPGAGIAAGAIGGAYSGGSIAAIAGGVGGGITGVISGILDKIPYVGGVLSNLTGVAGGIATGATVRGVSNYLEAEQAYSRLQALRPGGTGFSLVGVNRRNRLEERYANLQAENERDLQRMVDTGNRAATDYWRNYTPQQQAGFWGATDATGGRWEETYAGPQAARIASTSEINRSIRNREWRMQDLRDRYYTTSFSQLGLNYEQTYRYGRNLALGTGSARNLRIRALAALGEERAFGLEAGALGQTFGGLRFLQRNPQDRSVAGMAETVRVLFNTATERLEGILPADVIRDMQGDTSLMTEYLQTNNEIQRMQLQQGVTANATQAAAMQASFRMLGGSFARSPQMNLRNIQGIHQTISQGGANQFQRAFIMRNIANVLGTQGQGVNLENVLAQMEMGVGSDIFPQVFQSMIGNLQDMDPTTRYIAGRGAFGFRAGESLRFARGRMGAGNFLSNYQRFLGQGRGIGIEDALANIPRGAAIGTGYQEQFGARISDATAAVLGKTFTDSFKQVLDSFARGEIGSAIIQTPAAIGELARALFNQGIDSNVNSNRTDIGGGAGVGVTSPTHRSK